jgi:large repetitive protein
MRTSQRLLAHVSTGSMSLASLLAACAAPTDSGGSAPPLTEELQPLVAATKLSDLERAGEVSAVGAIGDLVYLETGTGLWFTDGTAAGTRLVHPGAVKALDVLGSSLFYADAGALWQIGSTGSAVKVIDLPGLPTASAAIGAFVNRRLAFAVPGADQHLHLWVSDGTAAGTKLTSAVDPAALRGVKNLAFFGGQDPLTAGIGEELWASDGTVAGTRLVKDLHATGSSSPHGFTAWPAVLVDEDRANVLFAASAEGTGTELWKSDGTSAGTLQLGDIHPGPESSDPRDLVIITDDSALFSASSSASGKRQLWHTGFTPGTHLVHEVEPMGPLVYSSNSLARGVFFAGRDEATGVELWKSDGTQAKTSRVFDLARGPLSSNPAGLHYVRPHGPLVFSAESPTSGGPQLMMLAPGSSTPEVLATWTAGPTPRAPRALTTIGKVLLVLADGGEGPALWGVDLSTVLPPPPPPTTPTYDEDVESSCSAGRGAGGPLALAVLSLLLVGRRRLLHREPLHLGGRS